MIKLNHQYITDKKGKKISVIIPIKEYESLIEELEDMEDVRLYDEAKKRKSEFIDAKQAFKEIEKQRSRKNVQSQN